MLDIFQFLLDFPKFFHFILVFDGQSADFLVDFIDFIFYSGLLPKQHNFLCLFIRSIGCTLIFF